MGIEDVTFLTKRSEGAHANLLYASEVYHLADGGASRFRVTISGGNGDSVLHRATIIARYRATISSYIELSVVLRR